MLRIVYDWYSWCLLLVTNIFCNFSLGGKAASGFVERCVSYIGENAAECVRTNSFLSLPKDAVIKVISSDYVSNRNRLDKYFGLFARSYTSQT